MCEAVEVASAIFVFEKQDVSACGLVVVRPIDRDDASNWVVAGLCEGNAAIGALDFDGGISNARWTEEAEGIAAIRAIENDGNMQALIGRVCKGMQRTGGNISFLQDSSIEGETGAVGICVEGEAIEEVFAGLTGLDGEAVGGNGSLGGNADVEDIGVSRKGACDNGDQARAGCGNGAFAEETFTAIVFTAYVGEGVGVACFAGLGSGGDED